MSEAVIDQATFDSLKEMVGDDYIGELIDTFLEESPGIMAQMNQALEDGDAAAFRRAAHSLKSNSASFGARPLESLARDLEYMGRDGQLDAAATKMPELEAAYEEAAGALKEMA
jgi:HPt (histidine-containing phosphotransfer) domain-containing protein